MDCQPAPKNFNELALLASYLNPALSGIVIGPRNRKQLDDTMNYWDRLKNELAPGQAGMPESFCRVC